MTYAGTLVIPYPNKERPIEALVVIHDSGLIVDALVAEHTSTYVAMYGSSYVENRKCKT